MPSQKRQIYVIFWDSSGKPVVHVDGGLSQLLFARLQEEKYGVSDPVKSEPIPLKLYEPCSNLHILINEPMEQDQDRLKKTMLTFLVDNGIKEEAVEITASNFGIMFTWQQEETSTDE